MKRRLYVFLALLLLFQTISSSLAIPIQANALNKEANIVKNVEILDEQSDANVEQEVKTTTIRLDWSIADINVEKGMTYTVSLPEEIRIEQQQEGELVYEEVNIGNYTVTKDNKVTISFNESVEQAANATGTIVIEAQKQFKQNEEKPEQSQEVATKNEAAKTDQTNPSEHEISQPKENNAVVTAEASSPTNKTFDATQPLADVRQIITENILTSASLSYEDIDGNPVDKPGIDSLISIDYTWTLENGHSYKGGDEFRFQVPNELEIYTEIDQQEMMFNGEVIGYFSVNKTGEAIISFTPFIEEYSNIHGNLQIWTELSEEIIITEDKEIIVTPIDGEQSTTIPIDFQPTGPSVDKKGLPDRAYNATQIEWTIDFNKSLETLQNARLEDPILAGQSLKQDSVKLYYLNTKLNGETSLGSEVNPAEYSIGKTSTGDDFTIDFHQEIKSAYRVVYETMITDEDQATFQNNAKLLADTTEVENASAVVTVGRGTPLDKKSAKYDKENQTITWEIKYNYNEKAILKNDALLKDFFNDSQELLADSFIVKKITLDEHGKEVGEGEVVHNYTVAPQTATNKNGFHLQFSENIDTAYKIIYQTKAIDRVYESETITNRVESGSNGKDATQKIGQQILFKNHGEPNYKDKTIEWTITFNKDKHKMDQVVLTDNFTNEGLTLLPETIRILNGNVELEKDIDYVLSKNEQNQFEITFNSMIETPHTIIYTTAFDFEKRQDQTKNHLENQAILTWNDEAGNPQSKEAITPFEPDDFTKANGFKAGSYNAIDKEITWSVGINYNLKSIQTPIVEDYIIGNQQLLKDSILVYEMDLTGGVNGAEPKELVPSDKYTVTWINDATGNPGFQLAFHDGISAAYNIVYKTSLNNLDLVEERYENTATLYNGAVKETDLNALVSIPHGGKYTAKSGVQNGKIIDWQVDINFGQSQIVNATVIDEPSINQALLEGSFQLFKTTVDAAGNVTKSTALEKGKDYTLQVNKNPDSFTLTFVNEINEPYILEYQSLILEKPGQQVSNNISFNGEKIDLVENESSHTITVKRTAGMGDGTGEIGNLTVTKTDQFSGEVLQGATFILQDKDSGAVIGTQTTGEDGRVVFNRLLYGEYVLIEEEAPEGYLINQASQTVTIDQPYVAGSETEVGNELTVLNQKIIRAVALTKIDKETGELLAGAEFALQKKNGATYETIQYAVTDKQGLLSLKDLAPGDYQFVEHKAPIGYQLDATPITFTIKADQTEIILLTAENIELGSVELTKFAADDENNVLEGAQFRLEKEDGTVVHTSLQTNAAGKITVPHLEPGNYQFVEIKAPTYYQLNPEPIPFTIQPNDSSTILLKAPNHLIRGAVELIKVDGFDNEIGLKGATFTLLDHEGNLLKEDLVTGEGGKLIIENLAPGKYQLMETKAPLHYQRDGTPIDFTINKSETEEKLAITKLQAENDLIPGSVELTKVSEENMVLANAVFDLQDSAGNTILPNLTTDANGKIIVHDLRPGLYQFVETKAPTNYALDQTPIQFEIVKSQQEMVAITTTNELIKGIVEVTKVDAEDRTKTLAGAEFSLLDAEGNKLQEGLTTDSQGMLRIENLMPGNYELVETKAPFGYLLDETIIPIEIKFGQEEPIQLVVENEVIRGDVKIRKVDADTNEPLAGAEFELRDANGSIVSTNLVTNSAGEIDVHDLRPGEYRLIETKAPAGYEILTEPILFTIELGQQEVKEVVVKNVAIPQPVLPDQPNDSNNNIDTLPQTGETFFRYLMIFGGFFIIAGLVLIFGRRKQIDY
ncbi:SpaA isopeptide-forming pilin-related protein [Virgibacillus sp. LDC-1]|uniref:SpaA isopeptide-forming pilin-related protein n=1 Tax=Virgibacillus sp. LDC-1 TaxID=3039856 RepID=UPI0024DEFC74|nr:SpaA isopeptide-forming pilin-related protein [Virgibacillus sp. LDC-1]